MDVQQTIVVTGASGCFGRQVLGHLLAKGSQVIAVVHSSASLTQLHELFSEQLADNSLIIQQVDLANREAVETFCEQISAQAGYAINALVNMARSRDHLAVDDSLHYFDCDNFNQAFNLEVVMAALLATRLTQFNPKQFTRVVNVASIYGITANNLALYDADSQPALSYGVCKAALIHLTKELAVRLASEHVLVNAVSYGGVRGRVDAAFEQRYAQLCPSGQMLTESDIAEPIAFLCSPTLSGMTGHNLVVDGGWTIW